MYSCRQTRNSERNGPYAPFGFESIEKQLWRNKQNDRPISDSEIKAVLSQLFKTDQWLPPAGHVSEYVTSPCIRSIGNELDISHGSGHEAIIEHLEFRKVYA
ncbi:hypothetical protein AVEN_89247-1 [Araneus ventricosus]|uniref:Uncharacterized protein n=1 Tax=Araneus ventricosus TaxID=182803 RepID=A0A4Y2DKV0_ARAVE|nr:hypothetical protein AVEN_89247-1 [Araneus ventricosus]